MLKVPKQTNMPHKISHLPFADTKIVSPCHCYRYFIVWPKWDGGGWQHLLSTMWLGQIPARYHAWVEFVVGSHFVPRVFPWVVQLTTLHKKQHLQIPS